MNPGDSVQVEIVSIQNQSGKMDIFLKNKDVKVRRLHPSSELSLNAGTWRTSPEHVANLLITLIIKTIIDARYSRRRQKRIEKDN